MQDHLSFKKSLLDVIRTQDRHSKEKYSIVFADQLVQKNEIFFFKIDGKVLDDDLIAGEKNFQIFFAFQLSSKAAFPNQGP